MVKINIHLICLDRLLIEKQTNTQALTEDRDKATFHTTVALDQ